jgi:hypothetical protein
MLLLVIQVAYTLYVPETPPAAPVATFPAPKAWPALNTVFSGLVPGV